MGTSLCLSSNGRLSSRVWGWLMAVRDNGDAQPVRVNFDNTVNLGHLLIVGTVLASAISTYIALRITINEHDFRISRAENESKIQNTQLQNIQNSIWNIQSDVAVIKDRMNRADKK